jgi:phage gp36-like protein
MGAYATRAQLVQFSVPSAALTGISTPDQDAALQAASRVADSYLVKRWQLPLQTTPTEGWGDDLRQAVCDIAAYRLLKRRGFNPEQGDDASLRMSYEDAVKWLENVAKGSVTPIDLVDSNPSAAGDTDAAGELEDTTAKALVLQARDETLDEDEFWEPDPFLVSSGVGSPKRRGW